MSHHLNPKEIPFKALFLHYYTSNSIALRWRNSILTERKLLTLGTTYQLIIVDNIKGTTLREWGLLYQQYVLLCYSLMQVRQQLTLFANFASLSLSFHTHSTDLLMFSGCSCVRSFGSKRKHNDQMGCCVMDTRWLCSK